MREPKAVERAISKFPRFFVSPALKGTKAYLHNTLELSKSTFHCLLNDQTKRRIGVFISAIIIFAFVAHVIMYFIYNSDDFNSYGYTEFLINFEGGFVRRGLLGQILYEICLHTGWSPFPIILGMSVLMFVAVAVFFFRKFRQNKMCWWILLSPFMLGLTSFIIRKDFLCYAILISILYLLHDNHNSLVKNFLVALLMFFGLFVHEAFIFWGVPIGILVIYSKSHNKALPILLSIALLLVFAVLSMFKGSWDTVAAIYQSWNDILTTTQLDSSESSNSIGALGWGLADTIKMHLTANFHADNLSWCGIYIRPMFAVLSYYFIMNFTPLFMQGDNNKKEQFRKNISGLYLFSLICLIPMFTVLSCDYSRLYQYAFITSYATVLIIPQSRLASLFPRFYTKFIDRINVLLNSVLRPTKGLLTIMLLFLAPATAGFSIASSFINSIFFYDFFFLPLDLLISCIGTNL